jgi:hypothetical protein
VHPYIGKVIGADVGSERKSAGMSPPGSQASNFAGNDAAPLTQPTPRPTAHFQQGDPGPRRLPLGKSLDAGRHRTSSPP